MRQIIRLLAVCTSLSAAAWSAEEQPGSIGRGDLFEGSQEVLDTVEAIERHMEGAPEDSGPPMQTPRTLTVRQCVQMTLSQNAQVGMAEAKVDAARSRIGQARSQWFPQIDASTSFIHLDQNTPETNKWLNTFGQLTGGMGGGGLMGGGGGGLLGGGGLTGGGGLGGGLLGGGGGGSGLGGGLLGGGLLSNFPLLSLVNSIGTQLGISALFSIAQNRLDLGLTPDLTPPDDMRKDEITLTQVFYAGGQIRAAVRASKYLTESQEWTRAATMADLEYQTKEAYYDALLAHALVRVAEESVHTFERNLADAEEMFDVGMISNFEVLRARTELGNREAQLVTARNRRELALANLRRILSIPQNIPVQLEWALEWEPDTTRVRDHVAYALEHRPEILSLEEGIRASEQEVRRVKGSFLPSVAGSIKYENTHMGGPTIPDGMTYAVNGQWEVFSGLRRKHELDEAKANLMELEDQLMDIERLVELDVTQAHIQIQDAMASVKSERGNVELAREGLRLAELRFKEGVGTQSETLDAELAVTSAETNLAQAIRNYAVANAALERATGRSWFAPTSKPEHDKE